MAVSAALAGAAVAGPSTAILAAVVFFAALLTGGRAATFAAEARSVVTRLSVAVVGLSVVAPEFRQWLTPAAAAAGAALIVAAFGAMRRARATAGEPTILVGEPEDVRTAAQLFSNYAKHNIRPVATATADGFLPTVLPGGSADEIFALIAKYGATHVLCVSPSVSAKVQEAIGRARPVGVRLSVLPPLAEILTGEVAVVNVRGLPFITLSPRRAPAGVGWAIKRAFDFAAASVAVVALFPILVIAAVAVRLDTAGPVFFRQKRVGRNGHLFDVWKFRSMVPDAEELLEDLLHRNEASGVYFKIEDDPRVTRVGKWLRRLSIDELPQLFNVLRGEMSLVGPRPFLASELAADPEAFEWRLPFLPGITGLWQIAGRSWLPRLEGMRMDLSYIEHWSLALDLRILLRTLAVAIRNDRRPPVEAQGVAYGLDRAKYVGLVEGDDLRPAGGDVDVSVVIVTHESAAHIEACLASLSLIRDRARREIIVVDNASTDATVELIEDMGFDVRLIRKRTRDGFSVNSNIGAVASSGRHVLLLNPDTHVFDGAVDKLVAHLDAHPEVGAVGPRLLYPDGSLQHSARRFPSFVTSVVRRTPLRLVMRNTAGARHHLMMDTALDSTVDVDWMLGAALAIRGDALREVGGLDDKFRLYCEDIDVCWRLHDVGWKVHYLPAATVQHDLGELTSKRFMTVRTIWHFRSMARFVRVHGFRRPAGEGSVRRIMLTVEAAAKRITPAAVPQAVETARSA